LRVKCEQKLQLLGMLLLF